MFWNTIHIFGMDCKIFSWCISIITYAVISTVCKTKQKQPKKMKTFWYREKAQVTQFILDFSTDSWLFFSFYLWLIPWHKQITKECLKNKTLDTLTTSRNKYKILKIKSYRNEWIFYPVHILIYLKAAEIVVSSKS